MISNFTALKITFAVMAISCFACVEQNVPVKDESTTVTSSSGSVSGDAARSGESNQFNNTVGAPIEYTLGQRWIENYESPCADKSGSYTINATSLKAVLGNGSPVGVSLVYALDFQKRLHILPIGIDSKGKRIKPNVVYTQHGNISWKTAQQWISNYTGSVQSHFFGQNTFSRLWANGTSDILIAFAADDNNNPQLLLSTKSAAASNGKTAAKSGFEDASSPCPPVCPK
jgi:hypothetical protein